MKTGTSAFLLKRDLIQEVRHATDTIARDHLNIEKVRTAEEESNPTGKQFDVALLSTCYPDLLCFEAGQRRRG
jgi:hypothetical protein